MKSRHIRNVSILAIFVLIICFSIARYYGMVPPLHKVTNPGNPLFVPQWFSFTDYPNRESKIAAFRKLFPKGTPKEYVDEILVGSGGAMSIQASKDDPNRWIYSEPRRIGIPPGPSHTFIYDEKFRVTTIIAFNIESILDENQQ